MPDDLFDVEGSTTPGEPATVVLRVRVQPGAGRRAVVGRHGRSLKVRVAAPPLEGRANAECLALVAELLDVAPGRVELVGGERARDKRVAVRGVDLAQLRLRLAEALAAASAPRGTRPSGVHSRDARR